MPDEAVRMECNVAASAAVSARLRKLVAELRATGLLTAGDFATLETIAARLRRDPLDFGEPLWRCRGQPLQARLAVVMPWAVIYTVRITGCLVFPHDFRRL